MSKMKFVAAAILAASSVAHADPRALTFHSAIDLALGQSPDVAVAAERAQGAGTKADELRARRLPSAHLEVDARYYKEPYQIPFGMTPEGQVQIFTLHEQMTTFTVASVSQPLTGLAYLSEVIGASDHAAAASTADYDRTRLDVAYKTAEAYIRALEARATLDVANTSVRDIASELDRALKLRAADTYTDIDVLRFKSAKAAADQAAIRADNASSSTIAALVVDLGLHDGDSVTIADDLPAAAPALALTLEQAQQRAFAARPELHAARERVAAAEANRKAQYAGYVPDVRAIGAYVHTTGVQPFQPANEEYLGLTVSWNVWDWGATQAKVHAAQHDEAVATRESASLADKVALDVRQRWLDAKSGYENLAAAKAQVDAAEEAMRLQRVKFEAGAATTTDVLDAETEVARGRLQATTARYDYYLELVALARSMGDIPNP